MHKSTRQHQKSATMPATTHDSSKPAASTNRPRPSQLSRSPEKKKKKTPDDALDDAFEQTKNKRPEPPSQDLFPPLSAASQLAALNKDALVAASVAVIAPKALVTYDVSDADDDSEKLDTTYHDSDEDSDEDNGSHNGAPEAGTTATPQETNAVEADRFLDHRRGENAVEADRSLDHRRGENAVEADRSLDHRRGDNEHNGNRGEEDQDYGDAPIPVRERKKRAPRRNSAEAAEEKQNILDDIDTRITAARATKLFDIDKLRISNIIRNISVAQTDEYAKTIANWAASDRVLYGCVNELGNVEIADGNHRLKAMKMVNRAAERNEEPHVFTQVEVIISDTLESAAVIALNAQRHKPMTNIEKALRDVFHSFDTVFVAGCSDHLIATLSAFRSVTSHVHYVESADTEGRLAAWKEKNEPAPH